jgi:hypothetical protein
MPARGRHPLYNMRPGAPREPTLQLSDVCRPLQYIQGADPPGWLESTQQISATDDPTADCGPSPTEPERDLHFGRDGPMDEPVAHLLLSPRRLVASLRDVADDRHPLLNKPAVASHQVNPPTLRIARDSHETPESIDSGPSRIYRATWD